MDAPKTLQNAIVYFSDPDRAFQYALNLRWPNGVVACPRCNQQNHSFIKTRRIWYCNPCKKQFTLKVGTIFEDSPLGLDKWMTAFWMLTNSRNGVSSCEVARSLGITQKAAWFMLHRIRKAMHDKSFTKLGGKGGKEVEVDESFIGGAARNMHKWKRIEKGITSSGSKQGKVIVQGLSERGGRVKVEVVPNRKKKTLQANVKEHIEKGAEVFTDELRSYSGLDKDYIHAVINHAEEYVRGRVHTNGMENFWSLLKRGLGGTYVSVEPFHLFRYLDEQAFRYNNRKNMDDQARFETAMQNVAGKRLTYNELIGMGAATAH